MSKSAPDPGPAISNGLPEYVAELARTCGFQVHGWGESDDDESVLVEGEDVNYLGSRVEAIAFMTAWQQCVGIKLAKAMTDDYQQNRVRRSLLVVDTTVAIEPERSAQIVVRPQSRMFRGERIAIPLDIAVRFAIDEIRVGTRSTFDRGQSIPAIAFAIQISEATAIFRLPRNGDQFDLELERPAVEEFGRPWPMPPASTAMDITFQVRNTSQMESVFCALVLGKSAW